MVKIDPTVVTEQRGQPLKSPAPMATPVRATRNSSLDNQLVTTPQQPAQRGRRKATPSSGPPAKKYRSYEQEFEEEYHGPGVPAHMRAAKVGYCFGDFLIL